MIDAEIYFKAGYLLCQLGKSECCGKSKSRRVKGVRSFSSRWSAFKHGTMGMTTDRPGYEENPRHPAEILYLHQTAEDIGESAKEMQGMHKLT
jgi:hypothetical protein